MSLFALFLVYFATITILFTLIVLEQCLQNFRLGDKLKNMLQVPIHSFAKVSWCYYVLGGFVYFTFMTDCEHDFPCEEKFQFHFFNPMIKELKKKNYQLNWLYRVFLRISSRIFQPSIESFLGIFPFQTCNRYTVDPTWNE